MATSTATSKPVATKALDKKSELLSHEIAISKGDNWHQIIRDKIGSLFFNIASFCTDMPCKMHEKVTFF